MKHLRTAPLSVLLLLLLSYYGFAKHEDGGVPAVDIGVVIPQGTFDSTKLIAPSAMNALELHEIAKARLKDRVEHLDRASVKDAIESIFKKPVFVATSRPAAEATQDVKMMRLLDQPAQEVMNPALLNELSVGDFLAAILRITSELGLNQHSSDDVAFVTTNVVVVTDAAVVILSLPQGI